MNNSVYVLLRGRIGNQLFIYAFAREIQNYLGGDTEVIIDDTEVLSYNWENSLIYYNLPNVRYVHNRSEAKSGKWFFKYVLLRIIDRLRFRCKSYQKKFQIEKMLKPFLEKFCVLVCENGYLNFNLKKTKNYIISGYFQSEQYFPTVKEELKKEFSLKESLIYPNLNILENSNSVCISVKVEHNVGSSLYAVCGKEYWEEAIAYIIDNVPNPVFFVCSDNVEYVKEHLIDCSKYKVIFQDKNEPVYKSLAAMSRCKHFIIGNTSFGWWAQYLSENPNKIMIAPNQWMLVDMPVDLYDEKWTLIDVKKYLGDKTL